MKEKRERKNVISFILALLIAVLGSIGGASAVYAEDRTITRAQWLHELVELFDMTVEEDNYPDNYFSDISADDSYYRDIMVATEFGLVDVEAGYELLPDNPVTREYAAYTMDICLGYALGENETYEFNDSADFTNQDDTHLEAAQIAVNHNWIALTDGNFEPQKSLSQTEKELMFSEARIQIKSQKISADHDNTVKLADNVIEIPSDVECVFEEYDDGKYVTLLGYTGDLKGNDTFVMWLDGFPVVYRAVSVEDMGSGPVVKIVDGDIDSAIEEMNVEGSMTADLAEATQAGEEGSMVWIAGGTAEQNFEDGREITDPRLAGNVPIKAIKRSIPIKLADGLSAQIDVTMPQPTVNYRINGVREIYVVLKGDTTVSATIKGNAMESLGFPKSIDLINLPVMGIGSAKVSVSLEASGQGSLNYNFDTEVGLHYKSGQGTTIVKKFVKKNFSLSAKAELEATLTTSIGIDKIPQINGTAWAKIGPRMGLDAWTYGDGKKPEMCMDTHAYIYAGCGVTLKIFGRDYSPKPYNIWTVNNSPMRLANHYEDDVLVDYCTRNASDQRYYTKRSSKYFSDGSTSYNSGEGYDGENAVQPVYEYSISQNDKDEDVATITKYYGAVSAITVPETIDGYPVVAIGESVFEGNKYLRTMLIPDCITSIDRRAFAKTNLQSLVLPGKLEYLGREILSGNTEIREITIPKTLKEVGSSYSNILEGDGPFADSCIQSAVIEDGMTVIPANLFHKNTTLTSVVIPNTVTKIGNFAFAETDIASIEIPDTVTEICRFALARTKLTELKLPSNLEYIGRRILSENTGVTEILVPKTVKEAGSEYDNILEGDGPFAGSNIQVAVIEKGMTFVPANLFHKTANLTNVEIPNTATGIGSFAFAETNIADITIPDTVTDIYRFALAKTKLTELKLPSNLKYIGRAILSGNFGVTEITIPKTVEEIGSEYSNIIEGDGPFAESNIQKAAIQEGMTHIPENLFHKTYTLTSLTIPDSVTAIDRFALAETGLKEIKLPETMTTLGYAVFEGSALEQITLPESVTEMYNYVFCNCKKLTSVQLPSHRENIGEGTFSGCVSLESIKLPDTVTTIWEKAFEGCTSLKNIEWGKSLQRIKGYVFKDCTSLTDVAIPDTVTSIEAGVFENCDGLVKVAVPNSVMIIGADIFYDCDSLTDVALGNGITQIPESGFEHCDKLEKIVLPYRIKKIGDSAFKNCIAFTAITIPRATASIGNSVFSYPSKMTIYGVAGTYAETYAADNSIKFAAQEVAVTKATLDQTEVTLNKGANCKLKLTVEPANFTDEVNWRSTNPEIAAIDDSGLLTAKSVGTATIKVTAGNESVSCKVTVVQPVSWISLNKNSLSLEALSTYQLTARVYPEEAYNKKVEWSSSDETVAKVDQSGFVTCLKKGTAKITVLAKDGSGEKDTCTINVLNNGYAAKTVEDLESPHNYPNNCFDFWQYTSSESGDALEVTFDERTEVEEDFDFIYIYSGDGTEIGKYTGKQLSGAIIEVPGNTIRIKLVSDNAGNKWGFKVTDIIASESVKTEQKISVEDSFSKTFGEVSFNVGAILEQGDGELSYSSNNEAVAAVDQDGNVTINGVGTVTVTVTASETETYKEIQKMVTITVSKANPDLGLSYETDTIGVGQTVTIYGECEAGDIIYETDNPSVATVDGNGIVTGIGIGVAHITAKVESNANYEAVSKTVIINVVDEAEIRIALQDCSIQLSNYNFVYNGNAITPNVTVNYGNLELEKDRDYQVAYANNINPGQATVYIAAKEGSKYMGTVSVEFTIKPVPDQNTSSIAGNAFSNCDNLITVNIKEGVTSIGDYAFADCKNLSGIYFYGSRPQTGKEIFKNDNVTIYYPYNDSSWTLDSMESFGANNVTWCAWNPQTGEPAKRDLALCKVNITDANYVYDGSPKTLNLSVYDGTKQLTEGTDYTIEYSGNINAGIAQVKIQGIGMYGGSYTQTFTIGKAASEIKFNVESLGKAYGDPAFVNAASKVKGDGEINYSSDNPGIASIDPKTGEVTIQSAGSVTIRAKLSAGADYEASEASYTLAIGKGVQNITAVDITRTYSKKKQTVNIGASAKDNVKLSYFSNNKKVTVNASGKITIAAKFIGSAVITIQAEASEKYDSASAQVQVIVNPTNTSVKKVGNSGKKTMTVQWKKNTTASGYEIQYSTNKKFKSGVKTRKVSKNSTTKMKISKLTKGKKYYVRIRAYKSTGGKKYYSKWSGAKSVKIKK